MTTTWLFTAFSTLAASFPALFSPFVHFSSLAHDPPSMHCAPAPLSRRLAAIAQAADGKVGAALMLVETGEMLGVLNPDGQFPMQSVYKLPIAMAVLDLVDRGTLSLDQVVRVEQQDFVSPGQHSPIRDQHPDGVTLTLPELLRFTVQESDGTASDVVMRLAGGAGRVEDSKANDADRDRVIAQIAKAGWDCVGASTSERSVH